MTHISHLADLRTYGPGASWDPWIRATSPVWKVIPPTLEPCNIGNKNQLGVSGCVPVFGVCLFLVVLQGKPPIVSFFFVGFFWGGPLRKIPRLHGPLKNLSSC